jgi:hypothetical protein
MAVSKTRNDSALAPSAKKTRSGSETRKRGPKINFRVSESELAQIQVAAERAGLTVGSYVRSRSLKEPTTRAVRRPPVATAQLAQLLGLLSAAGSDLQRLAPLTVAGAADQDRDIHAVLSLLREAATAILQALGKRP